MGTRRGIVKRTDLADFSHPRVGGIIAMRIDDGDELIAAQITDAAAEIFIGTRNGQAIRFQQSDVREMGRTAYGVKGITLREGDEVVAMETLHPGDTILTVTTNGYGKRTDESEYNAQTRGGIGRINISDSERNGCVAGIEIGRAHV